MKDEKIELKQTGVKVSLDLDGEEGNAFFILAKVRHALMMAGYSSEFREAFTNEATSNDYNHLLETVSKVVEVEL